MFLRKSINMLEVSQVKSRENGVRLATTRHSLNSPFVEELVKKVYY